MNIIINDNKSDNNNLQIESIRNNCLKSRITHEYKELSKVYLKNTSIQAPKNRFMEEKKP